MLKGHERSSIRSSSFVAKPAELLMLLQLVKKKEEEEERERERERESRKELGTI